MATVFDFNKYYLDNIEHSSNDIHYMSIALGSSNLAKYYYEPCMDKTAVEEDLRDYVNHSLKNLRDSDPASYVKLNNSYIYGLNTGRWVELVGFILEDIDIIKTQFLYVDAQEISVAILKNLIKSIMCTVNTRDALER